MFKALLKKQVLETASFFLISNKNGKKRSPLAALGFLLLMVYAFGAVGVMFWLLSDTLCEPLVQGGLDWVYFALVGTVATAFGVIGGIFTAKARLFEAKDNELLLSMPIRPTMILFSRMISLYALIFFFEGLVFVPAAIRYFTIASVKPLSVIFTFLQLFIMPLGALAISCLLGWLLALLTARMRSKNLVTTVFSLGFLAAYFYLYSKINTAITYVIANGAAVGAKMKTALFPFWKSGLAATGDPVAFLWFILMFVGVFAVIAWLLAVSFLRVATMKRGEAKRKYKAKNAKAFSVNFALLKKEFLRFFKNAMIFLNAAMGTLLFVILPIVALFNLDFCRSLAELGSDEKLALILAAVLCGVSAMNVITASSVSLEGESIWLVQSLPVRSFDVLKSKLLFSCLLTGVPALVSGVVLAILFKISFWYSVLALLTVEIFVILCSALGLMLNLMFPNLHWTNELAAVKQSMSSLLAMFLNLGVVILPVGGFFLFGKHLPPVGYLAICLAFFAVASASVLVWLRLKGSKIFERLH